MVRRRGDIFGSTVNIAARLAAIAQAGQVVTDATAASALGGSHLVTATSVGPLRPRKLGALVESVALEVGSRDHEHVDPICRMHVATESPRLTVKYQGMSYHFYFCSMVCLRQFIFRVDGGTTAVG